MKKIIIYLSAGILIIGLLLFVRTLFSDYGTSSVEEVRIEKNLFYDTKGNVFSGTLKVESQDVNALFKEAKALFPIELFSGIGIYQNTDTLPKQIVDSLRGIVLHITIEDGAFSGQSEIYYDLRAGRSMVLNQEIEKGLGYYTSYLFNNRIRLATASFKDGALDGSSYLVKPTLSGKETKLMEAFFDNNTLKYIKRFYDDGKEKRVNNYLGFVKNGVQQEFYKEGQLMYEVYFEMGEQLWKKWYYQHPNSLRKEAKYTLLGMTESVSEFYPDGGRLCEMNDSVRKEWFSNGEIKLIETNDTIITNPPKGEVKTYYHNGQLHTFYVYNASGKENGPYSIYYINGELWEQGTMKDGENHGNLKKWYNNKQMAEDHTMVNGKIDGKYIRYYDNGQKWKEFHYKNGELHGSYKKWWKNGQVAEDHTMVNGKIDGKYVHYYDNGQKWKEFHYKNGELTGSALKWWMNGQMASKCDYSPGKSKCQKWDENGKSLD